MPEISRFFGIVVTMFHSDHHPPHFHVRYGEQAAAIAIDPLQLVEGKISPRVARLVREWASMHREELAENWALCRAGEQPRRIAPLE